MKISDILEVRLVDPVALAQRTANRYGTQTKYGKHWEPPVERQHVPLTSFDAKLAHRVGQRLWNIRFGIMKRLDPSIPYLEREKQTSEQYRNLFTRQTIPIRGLVATQPFVRTDDPDMLSHKLQDETAQIVVTTYNWRNFIMDGHHAVFAAALKGDATVNALYLDLDQFKKL